MTATRLPPKENVTEGRDEQWLRRQNLRIGEELTGKSHIRTGATSDLSSVIPDKLQ